VGPQGHAGPRAWWITSLACQSRNRTKVWDLSHFFDLANFFIVALLVMVGFVIATERACLSRSRPRLISGKVTGWFWGKSHPNYCPTRFLGLNWYMTFYVYVKGAPKFGLILHFHKTALM
jgi:hypothetical protein